MLRSIIPHDDTFFDFFDRMAAEIVIGARVLTELVRAGDDLEAHAARLEAAEHRADEIVHQAMGHLHKTFITPIDRAEIHRLVSRLDDILDLADAAAARIELYRPREIRPEAGELADLLLESTIAVQEMVSSLRRLRQQRGRILELGIVINQLENRADNARRQAMAALLRGERDPFEFIKWKEILGLIEEATDRCEDVSDVIEGIMLQNS